MYQLQALQQHRLAVFLPALQQHRFTTPSRERQGDLNRATTIININSMDDLQKGHTLVGTKQMVIAKIHAISGLQQKEASVSHSNRTKVSDVQVDLPAHIHSSIIYSIFCLGHNEVFFCC